MQTSNHILAKEGILTAFMIARKVNPIDIKGLKEKFKGTKIQSDKFQKLLMEKILKDTQEAFAKDKIPGLTTKEVLTEQEEKKRIMELTYFASIMAKKLVDNNVTKYHSCYVINAMVNMLGLTEEDFNEFHRKFSRFREGKPDDDSDQPFE